MNTRSLLPSDSTLVLPWWGACMMTRMVTHVLSWEPGGPRIRLDQKKKHCLSSTKILKARIAGRAAHRAPTRGHVRARAEMPRLSRCNRAPPNLNERTGPNRTRGCSACGRLGAAAAAAAPATWQRPDRRAARARIHHTRSYSYRCALGGGCRIWRT